MENFVRHFSPGLDNGNATPTARPGEEAKQYYCNRRADDLPPPPLLASSSCCTWDSYGKVLNAKDTIDSSSSSSTQNFYMKFCKKIHLLVEYK